MLIKLVCLQCRGRHKVEDASMEDLAKDWLCPVCRVALVVDGAYQEIQVHATHPSQAVVLTNE